MKKNHKDTFEYKPTGFKQVLRVSQNIVSYVVTCECEKHAKELFDVWQIQTESFQGKVGTDLSIDGNTVIYVIDMVKPKNAIKLYKEFLVMWHNIVRDYKKKVDYNNDNVVYEKVVE